MFEFLKRKGFCGVFKANNQFTESWVDRHLKHLQQYTLLEDGVIKTIFDNVRNIGLSVLPLLVAKALLGQKDLQNQLFPWLNIAVSFSLLILSLALFYLNAAHGLKKILELVKTPQNRYFLIALLMITYVCIATSLYVFSQYK
jgi:hypothetical protein